MTVEMIPTTINGQWTLLLPQHRHERPHWTSEAGWERARLDSMHEHLTAMYRKITWDTPNDFEQYRRPVIIDVGVEEGDLTALYAQWGCDVIMVEPNVKVWPNIRAIWQANKLPLPLVQWVGFASDKPQRGAIDFGRFYVEAEDGWPMCAHGDVIGDHAFAHLSQHAHIPAITLDELIVLRQVEHVDAITMDVEGSELRVLRGAELILRTMRPLVWVSVHTDVQWMDENYPTDKRDDVLAFMQGLDYFATHLATDHEEHWLFEPSEAL